LVSRVAVLPNGGPAVDVRHDDRRTALLARYIGRYGRVIRGNGQMPDTAGQPETTRVIPRSRSAFLVNRELLIATGTRPRARSERSSVRAGPLRSWRHGHGTDAADTARTARTRTTNALARGRSSRVLLWLKRTPLVLSQHARSCRRAVRAVSAVSVLCPCLH